MRYILQGGNIYATNLFYMNDAEEYSNGLRELKTIINTNQKKDLISEKQIEMELEKGATSYSISFSTAKDLLSQWSMYAGESGVSIAMDFKGKEKYKAYNKKNERENVSKHRIIPRKVHYCTKNAMRDSKYETVTNEIWNVIYKNIDPLTIADMEGNAQYIWKEMAPYVKRYEFSAEEEYRLVFDWTQLLEPFRIDYRNDKNVLKPYLDIECENGWPICEITVGPGFNQEVVFKSILHFLNNSELKVPKLTGSQFFKRCEKYFAICGEMPIEAKRIWESNKMSLKIKNEQNRFESFLRIRNEMFDILTMKNEYSIKLKKHELAKNGIMLSRSGIPYIF